MTLDLSLFYVQCNSYVLLLYLTVLLPSKAIMLISNTLSLSTLSFDKDNDMICHFFDITTQLLASVIREIKVD